MGKVIQFIDGLRNAVTGQGTSRDPRTATGYTASRALTQHEIHAAYTGSGLMRKIIRIPALDMVREGRMWEMEREQIEALEVEEKRHQLQQKLLQAETLRGLGGGAFILGLPGNPNEPAPTTIGRNGLAYINVVSRWHLSFDKLSDDATKPGYGEPVMWRMNSQTGAVEVHPSRVIPFKADTSAAMAAPGVIGQEDAYWGESTVQQVLEAVQDSDTARASFAALMHKARLTRVGIPRLMELVSTQPGEASLNSRLQTMALAESMHNIALFDSGDGKDGGAESITDVTYSFAGAKDILNAYAEFVCAISDIPATRLLGRSPEGMNSSGDGQQKDWTRRIRAEQTLKLAPCLDHLDRYLVPSALGSMPAKVDYDFAPLEAPDEDKQAARFKTVAEALNTIAGLNAMPEQAFNEAAQNTLVEGEWMPGLGQALANIPDDERFGIVADPTQEGGDPESLAGGGIDELEAPIPRRAANDGKSELFKANPNGAVIPLGDATPRPLYVSRKLLNGADLIAWAKSQGIESTLPASDMHVTVLYSRNAVDPMTMGESWGSEQDGGLVIKAGGPRAVERFGEGALVLQFSSWSLQSRHAEMVQAGASHDYSEYSPHVTIGYDLPADFDIEAIKPYSGELRFGPEVFEPLDLDWKAKITEQ